MCSLKVRCPRQRPACSRCTERGMSCVYLKTRKTGRKNRVQSQGDTAKSASTQTLLNDLSIPTTGITTSDPRVPSHPSQTELSVNNPAFWNAAAGSNLAAQHYPNSFDMVTMDLDEFLAASPVTTFLNGSPLPESATGHNFFSYSSRLNQTFGQTSTSNQHPDSYSSVASSAGEPLSRQGSHVASKIFSAGGTRFNESDSLQTALQLMADLSLRDNAARDSILSTSAIQDMLKCDQEAINTISQIICSLSSNDGYVVVLLSLSISKILNSYVAAARSICTNDNGSTSPHLLNENSRSSSNDSNVAKAEQYPSPAATWSSPPTRHASINDVIKVKEANAMLAQQILCELYQVQALITQLGERGMSTSELENE
ncbi:hypothetical protein CBER1_01402 [Cercospora berteroae]|uniref:Zn(2)-C6 fungal-type domain-containing protein n=1 Tax=Cercospora berteroae TaxID=357750 RepID=A0A2S6CCE1_9PEZI|nr:hypothetical protein CBER1_01402 [Cercospora berteroae]